MKQKLDRLTMKNPSGKTYRLSKICMYRESYEENYCIFGEAVNRLGQYEDIGTPEEFKKLKRTKERADRTG